MKMEKKEMLYEGKAKRVYATDNAEVLLVSYKDVAELDTIGRNHIDNAFLR